MSTCVSILKYVFILCTTSGVRTALSSGEKSHYEPCLGKQYQSKCIWLGPYRAGRTNYDCEVLIIRSEKENKFITDMIREAEVDTAWIRKSYSGYSNFYGRRYGTCFHIDTSGDWHASYECHKERRSLCVAERTCQEGWIGDKCDKQCHCHEQTCSRRFRRCKFGCEAGWIGPRCFQELAQPKVEYYCFRNKTHYALRLAMELTNSKPQRLVPLDSNGNPITQESYTQEYNSNHSVLEVTVNNLSSNFQPNYYETKIEGSTFEWSFRLRQDETLRVQNDYDFKVRCNFSEPDDLYSSASLTFEDGSIEEHLSAPSLPSNIKVEMFLSDSKGLRPLSSITIGQPVKLVLTQQLLDDKSSAKIEPVSLSPRMCFARSPDKKLVKQLSDADGCPIEDGIFGRFSLINNQLESSSFPAFGLAGYSELNITCSLIVCSHINNRYCRQTCTHLYYHRYKRSTADIEDSVLMEITASVNTE